MNITNDIAAWLYQTLKKYGFSDSLAKYITAQAGHETGNFKSKIYQENKNLFGLKLGSSTIPKGILNGHASYETYEDSVKDFKRYYQNKQYPTAFGSIQEYVKALKSKGYFEAPEETYLSGVKYFYKKYFDEAL